jgi:phosphoglycerate dehydrogenase-like enzyme
MSARTKPAETKLVLCIWSAFSHWNAKPELAETIRQRWPEMNVAHITSYEQLSPELPDADIFVGSTLRPPELALAKKLKWVHSSSAGVSQLTYPEMRNSGILLTNASGVFSVPMAEHTIGMMLALARSFPDSVRQQDRSEWSQQKLWDHPQQLSELNGKLLLIVGYGSIGRELASRAKAFGMRVWGVTRSGTGDTSHVEKILPAQELNSALSDADYLVLCAPESADKKPLIAAPELAKLKRGARLLNIGRGSLVDETALLAALENGTLAGAALDVTEIEPLPPTSPLWRAPNLFITPHTSAVSDRLWPRETALLMDQLDRWFTNRDLLNTVDFARGY